MYKVKPLYDIPKEMDLPTNMYYVKPIHEIVIDFGDATSQSSATATAAPALTNGSLSEKEVANCQKTTIKPKTPTKAIDEKMTHQVDGIVTVNGSPGGGGELENGTGIKKKRKNKNKNKTITSDTSAADDQVDLKEKSIVVQQSPPEKEPKKKDKKKKGEKKNESIVVQQSPPEKQPKEAEENEEKPIKLTIEDHELSPMDREVLEEVEARQLTIISKLTALKDNMTDLHEKALTRNVSGVDATDPGETLPIEYIDVVVNADPRRPPYSLLLFRKILKDFYGAGVRIKTHVHSSCTTPLPDYLKIFNIDEDENMDVKEALTIRLIWKNTADLQTELIVKPIHQIPIAGEGNLARYFSRILPMTFPLNYDTLNWTQLIKVDQLLEDSREKTVNFEGIEEHLKATGGPFLLGQMTIADFVFFSSAANALIHNYGRIVKFPLTQQWLGNCQIYGQFQLFNISI